MGTGPRHRIFLFVLLGPGEGCAIDMRAPRVGDAVPREGRPDGDVADEGPAMEARQPSDQGINSAAVSLISSEGRDLA